jgi:hypothetical protein
LIRVGADLSTDVLATENTSIIEIFVTPTRIIYGAGSPGYPWDDRGTYDYRSIPKSGGTPITLATGSGRTVVGAVVAGETVWVGLLQHTGTSAGNWINVMRSDGLELQQFLRSSIIGQTLANPASLLPDKAIHAITIAHDLSPSAGAVSAATLRSYDGATRAALLEHGSVPAGSLISIFAARNPQWGMPGLLSTQAASSGSTAAPLDVFFYQSSASGVTRVTEFPR